MMRIATEPVDDLQQNLPSDITPVTAVLTARIWVIIAFLILGGSLRLYQLGAKGLWGDEIWTALWSRGPLDEVWTTLTLIPDMPLMYALVNISTRFGGSEFWVRLPAALFGVASLGMFYLLADLTLGRRTAIVGMALITLSPIHIWYSQDARYYAQLSFLGIASVYFFYSFLTSDKVHLASWFGFLLTSIAALYTHLFAGWIIVAQGMFAVYFLLNQALRRDEEMQIRRKSVQTKAFWLMGALLVVALCVYPVALRLIETLQIGASPGGEGMARLRLQPVWPDFLTTAFLAEVVQSFSGGRFATSIMLPFFLVGLVITWRQRRDVSVLALCLLTAPFLTTFFLEITHGIAFKYFFYLLPTYLLLVAQGFVTAVAALERAISTWIQHQHSHGANQSPTRPSIEHAILLVLILSIALIYVRPIGFVYKQARTNDWRSLAAYLTDNVQPNDVVFTERWGSNALAYYLPPTNDITMLESTQERWQRMRYQTARIWLISLNGQSELQANGSFGKIADSTWQNPRWVYERDEQHDIFFPITEPAASIYVYTGTLSSPFIDFMDIDNADWTDVTYRHVAPGRQTTVDLTLRAAAPRTLALRYLDYPNKDLEVLVDGQSIGSIIGGSLGGWQTWRSQLPPTVGDTVRIVIAATGLEPIGLDTVELTYALPPVSAVTDDQSAFALTLVDQGIVSFDDSPNTHWTSETGQWLTPGDETRVALSIPDQAARVLTITAFDLPGHSLEIDANGYQIGMIIGGKREPGWYEESFVVPGGMGEHVLIQIRALGPDVSRIRSLGIQRVQ